MNGNAHVQAVLDLLAAAAAGTDLTVHDGQAPNLQDTPYLTVYADPGTGSSSTHDPTPTHLTTVVQVTAVGTSRWQAGWAADLARTALLGVTPTVTGRSCRPIQQEFAQPVRLDVDDPDLFVAMTGYRVWSD